MHIAQQGLRLLFHKANGTSPASNDAVLGDMKVIINLSWQPLESGSISKVTISMTESSAESSA